MIQITAENEVEGCEPDVNASVTHSRVIWPEDNQR